MVSSNIIFPSIFSTNSLFIGKGLILGPLFTSTLVPSSAGLSIIESSTINLSGILIHKSVSNSLGSVSTPLIAETAAVSGLTR